MRQIRQIPAFPAHAVARRCQPASAADVLGPIMTERPVIAVFADPAAHKDNAVIDAASVLGSELAAAGYDLVYSGADAVARSALLAGAKVTAVVVNEPAAPGAEVVFADSAINRL